MEGGSAVVKKRKKGVKKKAKGEASVSGQLRRVSAPPPSASSSATLAMGLIHQLNLDLNARAEARLAADVAPHVPNQAVGSARFNLTLINAMDPSSTMRNLRPEPEVGRGGEEGGGMGPTHSNPPLSCSTAWASARCRGTLTLGWWTSRRSPCTTRSTGVVGEAEGEAGGEAEGEEEQEQEEEEEEPGGRGTGRTGVWRCACHRTRLRRALSQLSRYRRTRAICECGEECSHRRRRSSRARAHLNPPLEATTSSTTSTTTTSTPC